jgi:hypothetical protein
MAIIFIIVGVSVSGLCGLYAVKSLELRGAAKFFPTLRSRADRAAMRIATRIREIDIERIIALFEARIRAMLATMWYHTYRHAHSFFERVRLHYRVLGTLVRGVGIKTPLTKGSVSLFLQRISPEKVLAKDVQSVELTQVESPVDVEYKEPTPSL